MNEIQQARDVLAKWRDKVSSPLPWTLVGNDEDGRTAIDDANDPIVWVSSREEASSAGLFAGDDRLIVGTAGNPELLDAIDKMLEQADKTRPTTEWGDHGLRIAGQRIAAAIIAADERMSA